MSTGQEKLAGFTKPHMVFVLHTVRQECRYNVARLIEKHGTDMTIRDYFAMIGRTSCRLYGKPTRWSVAA